MTVRGEAPLTIAIDVGHVEPGVSGGLAHAVMGLVYSLGQLTDGGERYVIIVNSEQQSEWLKRFVGPNQRLMVRRRRAPLSRAVRALLAAGPRIATRACGNVSSPPEIAISDGFYETLCCDMIHFPHQDFTVCALPTIYNPHDLQHLHYPEFFSPREIARRQTVYEGGSRLAQCVVAASQWIKDDLVREYCVSTDRVQVIPWGAPTAVYATPTAEDLARVTNRYGLEAPFFIYPARSWPHKNHLRLVEALARLRDASGLSICTVLTGAVYAPHWPSIANRMKELRLGDNVKVLGFIPDHDLRALYRLAKFMMVPTLFESDSFPIYEAWLEGLPVGCSRIPTLFDQVGDAALLFEPSDVGSIADALERLTHDAELRDDLRQRGYRRLQDFDWRRTAKAYRAIYRRTGGQPLDEEQQWLLKWDWMREPQKVR